MWAETERNLVLRGWGCRCGHITYMIRSMSGLHLFAWIRQARSGFAIIGTG